MSQGSVRGPLWRALRQTMIRCSGHKCNRCGRGGRLELHHIKPLEKGGRKYDPDNLEVLCRQCHFMHHDPYGLAAAREQWNGYMEEL